MLRVNFSLNSLKKFKFLTLVEKHAEAKKTMISWLDETFHDMGVDWNNYMIDGGLTQKVGSPKPIDATFRVYLFVGDNRYNLSVTIRENNHNYLGATLTTTRYRVGEDWTRGADLADGDFCKETFDRIIKDILRNEFRKLETRNGKVNVNGSNRDDQPETPREPLPHINLPHLHLPEGAFFGFNQPAEIPTPPVIVEPNPTEAS